MRKFIILYEGREGSSPLVDLLGRHPQINIPIFEELDWYVAKDFCGSDEIARLLEMVLSCGDLKLAKQLLQSSCGGPPEIEGKVVGLKWRAWGPPEMVCESLIRSGAMILHLFRANLIELATSLYFTNVVIPDRERELGLQLQGGGHLQFAVAHMDSHARAEFRSRLHAIRFAVQVPSVVDLMRNILQRKLDVHTNYIQRLTDAGSEVRSITYEDFVERRDLLIARICGRIGLDPSPLRNAQPWYVKVNSTSICEQVDNIDDLTQADEVVEILARYRHLIFETHQPLLTPI